MLKLIIFLEECSQIIDNDITNPKPQSLLKLVHEFMI